MNTKFFINFDKVTGLSINGFHRADAIYGDIGDVVAAVSNEDVNIFCDLDGAKSALEDSIWTDGAKKSIEELYELICEWENELVNLNNKMIEVA